MVFDGFIFFNELDLLELRLETMGDVVDRFIVVESQRTFTNEVKPLYYQENRKRFEKYWDKIEYVVIDEFPESCKDAWDRERFQRNAIWQGAAEGKESDILIVSDLDEIVSPYGVKRCKQLLNNTPNGVLNLELLNFWYFMNYVDQKVFFWGAPKAYTIQTGRNMTPQEARSSREVITVACAGWHFSYMGGIETIKKKVKAFSHQEYNSEKWLNDERIEQMMREGRDLFDRGISDFVSIPICDLLPETVRKNKEKYAEFLCDYRPISKKAFLRLRLKYLFETTFLRGIYHMFRRRS